jgi:FkbM family methyltransferase
MRNCINASSNGRIGLSVETAHWGRMLERLLPDSLFLDVGAATGAMSVPFALSGKEGLRIVAFEPSGRARKYLQATIAKNNAPNVSVLPIALSDVPGRCNFIELPEDESGEVPFLPEASRLSTANETLAYPEQIEYEVEVATIDSLIDQLSFATARNIVIKIDVEGFEDRVLRGALETLTKFKPFLSIDIHVHPGTNTLTDAACEAVLVPRGFQIERIGHVLLAYSK